MLTLEKKILDNSVSLVKKEEIFVDVLGLSELKKNGFFSASKLNGSHKKNFWKSMTIKDKLDAKEEFKSSVTLVTAPETSNVTPHPSGVNAGITPLGLSFNDINAVPSSK
jgi:hypothetical protein